MGESKTVRLSGYRKRKKERLIWCILLWWRATYQHQHISNKQQTYLDLFHQYFDHSHSRSLTDYFQFFDEGGLREPRGGSSHVLHRDDPALWVQVWLGWKHVHVHVHDNDDNVVDDDDDDSLNKLERGGYKSSYSPYAMIRMDQTSQGSRHKWTWDLS